MVPTPSEDPEMTQFGLFVGEYVTVTDWLCVLTGGVLVVSTPSEDPEMKQKGVRHCNQGAEEGMLNMWRRMRDEGKITKVSIMQGSHNF